MQRMDLIQIASNIVSASRLHLLVESLQRVQRILNEADKERLAETCAPENELQLITIVQVAPNNIDDNQLLAEALPDLKQHTELKTIYTDGGHGGPATDAVLYDQQVEHIQTAIRGITPNPEKLNLADFTIKFNEDGQPVKVTCQQGKAETVQSTSQKKSFVAHFTDEVCQICSLADKCLARRGSRDPRNHLRFTQADARASERRRRSQEQHKDGRNLRAAIEASVRSLKDPFPAVKLPVRGKFRVACLLIGSAAVSNIRRIQRCLKAKSKPETVQPVAPGEEKCTQKQAGGFILTFARTILAAFSGLGRPKLLAEGC